MESNALSARINGLAENAARSNLLESRFEEDAKKASESFEAVFLFEVLQSMYADVKPGAFGGGSAEKIYQSMMNEEVAKAVSKQGGIGLADAVYRQIMKSQELSL